MMRQWRTAAATLLATALFVGGLPAIAQAAEFGAIIISTGDPNPGVIHVSVDTADPIASVHADFVDPETSAVVATADDFVLEEEQIAGRARYVTSAPVVMEPGRYDANVTITAADGTIGRAGDTLYGYQIVATVDDLSADRSTIDLDHREVTVSGVLRGRWPGTGEVRPLGGALVGHWVHQNAGDPIVTASDGTFTRTFTMSGLLNTMEFFYDSGFPQTRGGGNTEYAVTVVPQQTRVRVQADKRRVKAGDPVTLTGKVERLGVNGWTAVPEQTGLWVESGCDDTGCPFGYNDVQLAADGTFRTTTPAQRTGFFRVRVTGYADFLTGSSGQTPVVRVTPAL
ncbi:hypothetical protein [Actinoplanes regularis]|nr:hypothetical protein [Actinoplanes regularis]GIE91530.1 hypothetical protein Are01nite_80100 [Actinoplanes regularis]